jgi:hypothetical protein
VSKVTEKIKTRSKSTPSENFNSHPLETKRIIVRISNKNSKYKSCDKYARSFKPMSFFTTGSRKENDKKNLRR